MTVGDAALVPSRIAARARVPGPSQRAEPGYTILAHKKKLEAEYAHLAGAEIGKLRKDGVEVQYDVDDPLLIGDCNGATLLEQDHICSPIVILEATFLETGEEALSI